MIEVCGECTEWESEKDYCPYNNRDYVYYNTGACAAGRGNQEFEENDFYDEDDAYE